MNKSIFLLLIFTSISSFAQIPSNYYDSANGLTGYTLKSELHSIISNGHSDQGYGALYDGYVSTDSDNYYENDGSVLDMYSEKPAGTDSYYYTHGNNQCGNYNSENDCYNREHIVPQSVFGSASPMQADIHFVVPSDGYVNGQRSNLSFGEVSSPTYTSTNGSKKGSNSYPGYSGIVFEPIDEFKGDIARMLFYFATRYETQVDSWSHTMFNGTEDQVFAEWFLDMLLEWHTNDAVNQRELDRNQGAYGHQGNANPFIDHPEWVYTIWSPNPDTEDPTAPSNLIAFNETNTSIQLSWDAATDNVAVTSYDVYMDGNLTANSLTTDYTAIGLAAETTYSFYTIAKDAAGNTSTPSNTANATTLSNPTYVIYEDFNDCAIVPTNFVTYNEASDKDWTCITTNGFDDTGCYQMNGFQEDVASKDWLITTNPIDFTQYDNEKLSIYLKYAYGSTPLELVYSTDYMGSGNPSNYTWLPVPNVSIDTPSGSSTDTVQELTTIDISSISQSAYIAFKYYSNGSPTRWNVDNFVISADPSIGTNDIHQNQFDLSIYPNPSNGEFFINSDMAISNISIFTLTGEKLQTINSISSTQSIRTQNLPNAVYILQIQTTEGKLIIKKLILNPSIKF